MCNGRIEHIKLKNYKCHRSFESDLKKLTILAGENSAGKSSVIQALLMQYLVLGKKMSSINTLNVMGNNLGVALNLISPESVTGGFSIETTVDGVERILNYSVNETEEMVLDVQGNKELIKTELYYLNAERIGPRLANQIYNDSCYVGIHGENVIYVIEQMDKMLMSNPYISLPRDVEIAKIKRFSANVEEWLGIIVPDTKISTKVNVSQGIASVEYNTGGDFFGATATGFGVTYVLPIIVQALIATTKKNALIIIENPEAHLHPYSQSMLGKFLALIAENGVQIVIETHSEHIIDGCRIEMANTGHNEEMGIIFFSRSGGRYEHENITVNDVGELSSWPAKFFDQSMEDLRELLKIKLCKQ